MKKRLSVILIAVLIAACKSLKPSDINNRSFKSQRFHMVGAIRIMFFNDSLFLLQERDGMFYSKGVWKKSPDGKSILLNSFNGPNTLYKGDTAAYFVLGKEKLEIDKNKLLYKKIPLTIEKQ
jgi:hypothetical protein